MLWFSPCGTTSTLAQCKDNADHRDEVVPQLAPHELLPTVLALTLENTSDDDVTLLLLKSYNRQSLGSREKAKSTRREMAW